MSLHAPMSRAVWLLIPLCIQWGCAASRGFDRQAMADVLGVDRVAAPPHAADGSAPQPRLPSQFQLALYFPSDTTPLPPTVRRANWLAEDKDILLQSLQPLTEDGLMKRVFVLADSTVQQPSIRHIRQAAARYQADIVMVVKGAAAVDRYHNRHAAWYATIIGAYLAPGTESDALFMMDGTIWDVGSGRLYGTARAEGTAHEVGPAASLDDYVVVAQAKKAAVRSFGRQAVQLLRAMAPQVPSHLPVGPHLDWETR